MNLSGIMTERMDALKVIGLPCEFKPVFGKWVKCSDQLPPFSFIESDDITQPYESHPVLVISEYSNHKSILVACRMWNEENEETWEQYVDGENGDWVLMGHCKITAWMPLPKPPED